MQENGYDKNIQKSELWTLSFKDLLYKYIRFFPWFVLSIALALFARYVYLRYATPIYKTSASIIIKTEKPGSRYDKYEDIFGGSKSQDIQNEIEVFKSKALMARVVYKNNLQISYFAKGKIKSANVYKMVPFVFEALHINDSSRKFTLKLKFTENASFRINNNEKDYPLNTPFENEFGKFKISGRSGFANSGEYYIVYQPIEKAAAALATSLKITPKAAGSSILIISMQHSNPRLAADVVNQLMQEYKEYNLELKKQAADTTLVFIEKRLIQYGKELDSLQDQLLRYMQRNNMFDVDKQSSSYFGKISETDRAVNEQQLQLNTADFIESYLRDKKNINSPVLVPSSLGLSDATLNGLVNIYNEKQIQRQTLMDANVPAENPSIVELNEQIEKLRISLLENLSNIKRSYIKTIQTLNQNYGQTELMLKNLPEKEKGLMDIKRQVENKLVLYNIMLQKREEAAISKASTIENSQVVEKALVPALPIKPSKLNTLIVAIFTGLAIPGLFVFFRELLNDKVNTRFDVIRFTQAPILGEIGHSTADKTLIVSKTNRSLIAEQFRIIRSNLQFINGQTDKSTILVTSSFTGEGKSFVCINLGTALALAGKKTIILELDIRKPKILSELKIPKSPGITNYLIGKAAKLDELIIQLPGYENLYVLGCGLIPPNPSELLLDPKVEEMFSFLKQKFNYIIIDTAPIGMVSDAQTLSKFANCTLFIVRQGYTYKKYITLIDEFYQDNKLPSLSIIINDVKIMAGYNYYGYGRYGYGYGYGYSGYYEEEKSPDNFAVKIIEKANPRNWFSRKK